MGTMTTADAKFFSSDPSRESQGGQGGGDVVVDVESRFRMLSKRLFLRDAELRPATGGTRVFLWLQPVLIDRPTSSNLM